MRSASAPGTPINKRPVLGYRNLNLFKLYRLVHKLGGFDNVSITHSCFVLWPDFGLTVVLTDSGLLCVCVCVSRLKAAPFGSKSIRTWGSLFSTLLLATMSNVLTASMYQHRLRTAPRVKHAL